MEQIATVNEMMQRARELRAQGRTLALVPTMGALHEGHLALIRAAKQRADIVIVSIFVNPLQFGANEGFAAYPRAEVIDVDLCATAQADLVFVPSTEEMYPRNYSTYVSEEQVSKPLCGVSRPNHFRGVTTVMAKLLNIVRPNVLVMGQKDAQQTMVVRKMIADLHFDTDVVVVPTIRESDGLAAGVRNRDLTTTQRQQALALHAALKQAQEMVASGVRNTDRVVAEATHLLGQHLRVRVIYISTVDSSTMEPMREIVPGKTMLAIAAWVDEVRLIDNVVL